MFTALVLAAIGAALVTLDALSARRPDPRLYVPGEPAPAAGYLGLALLLVSAWLALAAVVPALGWLALGALGLLLAPFVALLLYEVGELVADVLGCILALFTRGGRRGLVLASA